MTASSKPAVTPDPSPHVASEHDRILIVDFGSQVTQLIAQVRAFLARHPEFSVVPPQQTIAALGDKAADFAAASLLSAEGLLMTPRRTGTDGFFVSVLHRGAA